MLSHTHESSNLDVPNWRSRAHTERVHAAGLIADAQKLPAAIDELTNGRKEIKQTVRRLERAGCIEATPHYRAQRYLYLIQPQRDGERRRQYIRTDRKKQRAALASIERFKHRPELQQRAGDLDWTLIHVGRLLGTIYSYLDDSE